MALQLCMVECSLVGDNRDFTHPMKKDVKEKIFSPPL